MSRSNSRLRGVLLLLPLVLSVLVRPAILHASSQSGRPFGMAWAVRGEWYIDTRPSPLRTGDAIPPSVLLRPTKTAEAHSITLLMPDGQRILYECFRPEDCARGFRVPSLSSTPTEAAGGMLMTIQRGTPLLHSLEKSAPPAPLDELVTAIDTQHNVVLTGLIDKLPAGSYTCLVRDITNSKNRPYTATFIKTARPVTIPLPEAGLYLLTIRDAQGISRMKLTVYVVTRDQSAREAEFAQARKQLSAWNEEFDGWPVNDLLRAYLCGLVTPQTVEHNAQIAAP